MPYTVTHSHGREFKEYGIFKGSQGVLVGWILEEEDAKALADNEDGEVVLSMLPKILFLQMSVNTVKETVSRLAVKLATKLLSHAACECVVDA